MRLIYTTKKKERLMQIEWKWWDKLSRANFKHKLYTTHNLWEEASLPSLHYTLCLLPKMGITFKCHFFLGNPKTRTFVVRKLWTLIYFSNQVCFENMKTISYSLQKTLSNGLQHAPIRTHLTPAFKGFVVESQIPNLIHAPSFDHNSCKSSLNDQCEVTLSI